MAGADREREHEHQHQHDPERGNHHQSEHVHGISTGIGSLSLTLSSPLFDDHWYIQLPSTDHVQFFLSTDWAVSRLGPLSSWDLPLRLQTFAVLSDSHSCCLYWGPEKVAIYNEAFAPLAGKAHPKLMGQTFMEGFPEIWPVFNAVFDQAEQSRLASEVNENLLYVERNNFEEETYFTGNFNPIRGLSGKVEGFHNSTYEVTKQIIGNRRAAMLNLMEIPTGLAKQDLASYVVQSLESNPKDITMALLYEIDDETVPDSKILHLRAHMGLPVDHPIAVESADLDSNEGIIDLLRKAGKEIITVPIDDRFVGIRWGFEKEGERISSEFVSVLPFFGGEKPLGYLVVGANPRRPVDEEHHQFMRNVASKVSAIAGSVITAEEAKRRGERLEKQLGDFDRQIRDMALNASVGMLRLSMDAKIVWANDQYFALTGSPPLEGSQTYRFLEIFLEEDRESGLEAWRRVFRTEKKVTVELRLRKMYSPPSGEPEPGIVQSILCPIFEGGKATSITTYLFDISAFKWAERTEARKAHDARDAKKQQEDFIDIVSHEMRNPLTAILMSADSISTSMAEVNALGITEHRLLAALQANIDSANTIVMCANHQKRIVDDVLTLSKLDYMMLSITTQPVKLQELINSSLKMFESDLQANSIQATPCGDPSIKVNDAEWVSCDPSRVTQIIVNFLTNAIKFTKEENQRDINVRYGAVASDPQKAFPKDIIWAKIDSAPATPELLNRDPNPGPVLYLTFAVEDSGMGMTSEEMQQLFGRFVQANIKTSINYGGSGLGLFICKKLAETMGGEIGVMSRAGKGSTFVFYIEAHRAAPEAVETHIAEPEEFPFPTLRSIFSPVQVEPSTSLDLEHMHVLLVEDNEVNQKVLAKQLRKAGCTVTIANHGAEALEKLKETRLWRGNVEGQKLDIILMDWEMPVMDGLTCAQEIRKWEEDGHLIGPHVEIIATTANAREEQQDKALKSGIIRFRDL